MQFLRAKNRMKCPDDPTFQEGAQKVLDFLYNIWQEQKLCDVLITANDGDIQAHKIALGAFSDALLTTFYHYNPDDMVRINLSDFRSDVIMSILYYLYTTELELNSHVIGQVKYKYFSFLTCVS